MDRQRLCDQLAHKLRRFRTMTGRSQQEVADYCGLHRSTYTYYECGRTFPTLITLVKLSRLYGVSVDYLLGSGPFDKNNQFCHVFEYKRKVMKKRDSDMNKKRRADSSENKRIRPKRWF